MCKKKICSRSVSGHHPHIDIEHDVRGADRGEKSSQLSCLENNIYTHTLHTHTHARVLLPHSSLTHDIAGMVSRESSRPPSRSVYYHTLSRHLLTPPLLPSLDSFVAVVTSTPPFSSPFASFSPNDFHSFGHSQRAVDPSTGFFPSDPLFADTGASGVKEDVWLGGTAHSTSPSSPFTYVANVCSS